jgi:1-pyrroline-5-carboxylate dehydrogenase
VPRSIWTRLRDDLAAQTEAIAMGDVTDLSNFMGAVIDDRAFAKHKAAIERAKADDSITVVAGGAYDERQGWFVRPTVLESSDPDNEIFTTEYFGPILGVHVYDDADYAAMLTQMAPQNLMRWTSTRSIKETLVPPTDYRYPHMG